MQPRLPSISELRSAGSGPRVHPNGFIQVDLSAQLRLHVWHPLLPYRQRTYHPVHDHTFDIMSHVYSGRLVNVCYAIVPDEDGTHVRWQVEEVAGTDTELRPTGGRVRLAYQYAEPVQPGEGYEFPAYQFHESMANEPTLTIMEKRNRAGLKEGADCQGASVIVPVGVEPDNEFRREDADPAVLWKLIEEAHPCA